MVGFNQGLTLGTALKRCHSLDDQGLYWFEEPIVYDNRHDHETILASGASQTMAQARVNAIMKAVAPCNSEISRRDDAKP